MKNNEQEKNIETKVDEKKEEQKIELSPLQESQIEAKNWQDKYMRCAADFNNFKKRTEKERISWMSMAKGDVLKDILNILDDFDRAFEKKEELSEEVKNWLTGFEMIQNACKKVLEKNNVKEIEQMKTFDPNFHEALMQVESGDHEEGDVVAVLQKGFMLGDQVLRHAKVSVAK